MKKMVFGLILVSGLLASQSLYAATCASKKERQALNNRALQSQLMVAALTCGNQKDYNKFMTKFRNHFASQSKSLKGYFKRNYNGKAKEELTGFMTALANESSRRSLNTNYDSFCKKTKSLFNEALSSKPAKLHKVSESRKISSLHGIEACD